MTVIGLASLYRTMHLQLGHVVNGRTYPDLAPADTERPFVLFARKPEGGETDVRRRPTETHVLMVEVIAERIEDAFDGAGRLVDLLRDQGSQESNGLPIDANWEITTVSQGVLIYRVELWNGVLPLYHCGYEYTFTLEKKG